MEYKHNNGPFLVVVPLSTLSNWVNEFNKWCPSMLKVVYKGAPDDRKRIFRDEVESGQLNVLLTTYEYIMKDKGSLRRLTWQYIIVDEGHRMKNAQSKFAQTLGSVYQSRHRILLTGTPLQNNLPELWALLNFLLPTIFSSVDTFDQWFNKPFTAFRTPQGPQAAEEASEVAVLSQEERMLIVHRLHEVLRPFMLRRVKDQVLDQLPEKVEKVLRCNLSGWQRKMYHSITMKGLGAKDKEGASGGLNNTIMQLRKVCNHPYLFMRDYAVDEDLVRASGKFELLDRMLPKLKAAGHRVLLFSQMVELMNFLEQFFLLRGFQYLRLDGNTSSEEREKRMFMFNDPDSPYFIFLLSTRAGGLGLNLATADTVIIFDSDWNPMMDAQAQDRAHRIGQKNEVRVFRLLTTSPIEERILSRANDKKNLTGLVVEAGKFSSKAAGASANSENKELMESMLKEWSSGGGRAFSSEGQSSGDYEGEEDDLPDDEQINEMMASYAGEMQLYQAMDAQRLRSKLAHWASLHQVTDVKHAPPLPSRLMGAVERPYWLTTECWPTKYSVLMQDMMAAEPGKKGRKKKSGSGGGVDFSSALPTGQSSATLHSEGHMAEVDSGSEEDGSDSLMDEEQQQHLVAGKVMRKRKDVSYDDGMTDLQYTRYLEKQQDNQERGIVEAPPQQQVAIKKPPKHIDADGAAVCGPAHKALLKALKEVQKVRRADGVSFVCDLFVEKPPKALYPDYYALIETPISLKEVTARLRKGAYRFLEEVETDLALMAHNARTFNMDTSQVFSDCETVRREFFQRAVLLRQKFGMPPAASDSMPPLPAVGHQIYGSPHSYRCSLLDAQGDDSSSDADQPVVVTKKGKRKIVLSASAHGNGKKAKLGGSSPPPTAAPSGDASRLSLSLKRNSSDGKLEQQPSLVLSFNRKSLQKQEEPDDWEEEAPEEEEEEEEE